MLNKNNLDSYAEKFVFMIESLNTQVLRIIGRTVKEIGKLRPTETHKLQQIYMNSNLNVNKIIKMITEFSNMSESEIYKIFEKAAKEDYEFSEQFYKYKSIEYVPFEEKREIQRTIKAVSKQTSNEFKNLSNTTVFALKSYKGQIRYVPIKKAYKEVIDRAVTLVQSGVSNYNAAMRDILKQYADSGIRKVEYESGYSRRLDTAVRQNIIDGVKQINQQIQLQIGKEFGADGVELSAHETCAKDHLPVQGKQFTNEEFKKLQSDQAFSDYKGNKYKAIKRPIGEWNCRHLAYSILLGVSKPNYSDEELEKIKKDNEKKIKIQGKEYTKYEATQEQRRLETAIRHAKDRHIIFKSSADNFAMYTEQKKITDLTRKYNAFSKEAGLKPQADKLNVYGYKKSH